MLRHVYMFLFLLLVVESAASLWWGALSVPASVADEWELANDRYNTMIFTRLRNQDGAVLCIGNYHMPCMFDQPKARGPVRST